MRKYAYLAAPQKNSDNTYTAKIMLYQSGDGLYLFAYSTPDAVQSFSDLVYDSLEDLYEDWNGLIDARGWIDLEDPWPNCQHDAFIPLRVKGRSIGSPQWGKFEAFLGGRWVDYPAQGR